MATAHGNALENVIKNPALNLLVGGIQVGGGEGAGGGDAQQSAPWPGEMGVNTQAMAWPPSLPPCHRPAAHRA